MNAFLDAITIEVGLKFSKLLTRTSEVESLDSAQARLRKSLLSGVLERRMGSTPPTTAEKDAYDPLELVTDSTLVARIKAARVWNATIHDATSLTEGYESLFTDAVESYRLFRAALRHDPADAARFTTDAGRAPNADKKIGDSELDIVLFVLLRLADRVFQRDDELLWSGPNSATIGRLRSELRTVVTVDEAPDFSWAQLGCMYYLAHPAVRAFSMSGDLMQRVTTRGLRSWEECDYRS